MYSTSNLKRVLNELPHFRIRSRDDFHMAERMLAVLICDLDALSPEQKLLAKAFKTQVERYRAMWSDLPSTAKESMQ